MSKNTLLCAAIKEARGGLLLSAERSRAAGHRASVSSRVMEAEFRKFLDRAEAIADE